MFTSQRPHCPSYSLALLVLELTPLLFNIWNSIRQIFFSTHILLLFVLLARGHMSELNSSLDFKTSNSHPVRSTTVSDPHAYFRCIHRLEAYYHEHGRMLAFARHMNGHIISQLLGAIFASNIAINLLVVGSLLFRRLYLSERLVMFLLISLQTFFALLTSLGMSSWSECFYENSSGCTLLQRAQVRVLPVTSGQTDPLYRRALVSTAKLRLMAFLETVCTRRKFRFTMGSLGRISHQSLYEFLLLYSSLLFYVAKMIRRGRL